MPVDGKISIALNFLQNQSSVINREQHLLHLINFSVLSEIVQEQYSSLNATVIKAALR